MIMNGIPLPAVVIVIFGAAGDLTWRKLIPAFYNLFLDQLMPEKSAIFGVEPSQLREKTYQRPAGRVNSVFEARDTRANKWKEFATTSQAA